MTDMRASGSDAAEKTDAFSGDWVGVAEAAAALGRSSKTLERWIRANKVVTRKIGDRRQVLLTEELFDLGEMSASIPEMIDMVEVVDADQETETTDMKDRMGDSDPDAGKTVGAPPVEASATHDAFRVTDPTTRQGVTDTSDSTDAARIDDLQVRGTFETSGDMSDRVPDTQSVPQTSIERHTMPNLLAIKLAQKQVERAQNEIESAKHWGRAGWLTAGALLVIGIAGGWWASKTTTRAQGRYETAIGQLDESSARMRQLADQITAERVRAEMLTAQLRTESAEAVVAITQLDRARADLERVTAERDAARAARAAQAAAVVHATVESKMIVESDPPGG